MKVKITFQDTTDSNGQQRTQVSRYPVPVKVKDSERAKDTGKEKVKDKRVSSGKESV